MIWPTPARHERRTRLDNIRILIAVISSLLVLADCIWGHDLKTMLGF